MAAKGLMTKLKGIKIPRSISEARGMLKAPWEITGPCSDPEYLDAVPNALEYRAFSPATAPLRARVPQAEPEHVYDIKYYTRDYRKNFKFQDRKTFMLSKAELEAEKESVFETKGFPFAYERKIDPLDLDNLPGNGYQA